MRGFIYIDPVDYEAVMTTSGCRTVSLKPGTYEVIASSGIPACLEANPDFGCSSGRIPIEIRPDEILEMDFEVTAD